MADGEGGSSAGGFGKPVDDRALADCGRDDIGNAERFREREGDDFRETQRLGVFAFDGRRWVMDDGDVRARLAAQRTARAIEAEAKALGEEARGMPDDPKDAVDKPKARALERARTHFGWARQSANSARLNAMIAQAMAHLQHPLEGWNANPDLLCMPDGLLDLSSIEPKLRPHRRDAYVTRMTATQYDPGADAPKWRAFLERVQPDPEIRAFLQRCAGACLVDSASDQVIVLCHGGGANGKSTFLDVVCDVLGDYAMSASVNTFLANDRVTGSAPQPDLVRLAYRPRLVRTSEPPPGGRLAEGVIKEVTGGEPMVVRDLQEKPIEFRPNWKVWISCNNLPSVRGGDDGIWRRIMLIPWAVQIPPAERDPDLKRVLLEERAGIFNWLLEGWAAWREMDGLAPPEAVLAASEDYRTESDAVGRFLREWCVKGEGLEVDAVLLHDAYEAWTKLEGMEPLSANIFGRRLSDRGLRKRKSSNRQYRLGIDLTEEARGHGRDRQADKLEKSDRKQRGGGHDEP